MHNMLSKTAFQPEEVQELREVYEHLTSERWFDQSPEAKKAFARHLIKVFPTVDFDPEAFRAKAEATARQYFVDESVA